MMDVASGDMCAKPLGYRWPETDLEQTKRSKGSEYWRKKKNQSSFYFFVSFIEIVTPLSEPRTNN